MNQSAEYQRGYNCVKEQADKGEIAIDKLEKMAKNDPFPTDFTAGWLAALIQENYLAFFQFHLNIGFGQMYGWSIGPKQSCEKEITLDEFKRLLTISI